MANEDDLFDFEIPVAAPEPKVSAQPKSTQPTEQAATLPSATARREFNWWAVLAVGLALFVGINALRSFWPAGGSGVDGLRVLIVEEKDDRQELPSAQLAILTSQTIREWCDENCTTLGGAPAVRVFDQDEDLSMDDPFWKELMLRKRGKLPWIYVVGGKGKQVDQALPKDVESTLELLESAK